MFKSALNELLATLEQEQDTTTINGAAFVTKAMLDDINASSVETYQAYGPTVLPNQINGELLYSVGMKAHPSVVRLVIQTAREEQRKLLEEEKSKAGNAPSGINQVFAEILQIKKVDGYHGLESRAMLRLPNKSTAWGKISDDFDINYRGWVEIRADFDPSRTDKKHAFFKRAWIIRKIDEPESMHVEPEVFNVNVKSLGRKIVEKLSTFKRDGESIPTVIYAEDDIEVCLSVRKKKKYEVDYFDEGINYSDRWICIEKKG